MPKEYDLNSHSQCQIFTPTTPTPNLTPPSHPTDQEIPNGQSSHTLWATTPPGSTFKARKIITNKVVSSSQSLLTNTPLGGLPADDIGLGKTIQAIALIGTSKERIITTLHCSMPTTVNHQLAIRNDQACSGWSTPSQHLPWPHSSLILQGHHLTI
ncbi:hypothetical protein O181_022777 [Austropuccinia psidii MF-1]|uniref:SNF2 N-terminal domain-containing protein n=1 Tax=Austropuccinia psidii MF-1 TaxID=1389203 RepID=A0A9Q3CI80_9BASI|nr:hypothetical protein [Austropuccinia psidii MF-1]